MQVQDFSFELPDALIARYPAANRTDSRLLKLSRETGVVAEGYFKEIIHDLNPGDCLVLNESRVMPALLWGVKSTGGES